MNIINPVFKIQDESENLFTIREKDYENILPMVQLIVQPVTTIGFQINEIALKESRFATGEIAKTFKQTLSIRLQKGPYNIDLSLFIPKIIDKNYVIINGRKKIPLFQLFDIPIVTRGENIKLRTNVATLMLSTIYPTEVVEAGEKVLTKDQFYYVFVNFLGKKIPLSTLLFAYYGPVEALKVVNNIFGSNLKGPEIKFQIKNRTNIVELLLDDMKDVYNNSKTNTQDDFIHEIGRIFSKYNAKSKGEDVVFAIDLIPKIDPYTAKFLETGEILPELLTAIKLGNIDDTLFTNKRVRCFEYMVVSKVSKIIFDLCLANRTARQPKFNINSTQILSECNVSDIVQFDFSINPIEELTKLSRISLLGPGGFKRENIPKHLRDICPSMFGRLCPVDTPDRDNCGVLQNMIVNVNLDENLRFSEDIQDKQPISSPVSMVPFLEHDDQTRLQMSSSQMRQAILLKNFDEPMIKSGCEHLYTDKTQFVKRATQDGEVLFINNKWMIVIYNDKSVDIFDIGYRKIYVEHMDFMNIYVKEGDKFKKGDILAESNFCKNSSIQFGQNLLTGVMIYYGNNYEDGIVVSDRLVKEDILTSIHFRDLSFIVPPYKVLKTLSNNEYKPLPNEFETVNSGEAYAITKTLTLEDPFSVFHEEERYETDRKILISEMTIFPNEWNTDIPQYEEWVKNKINEQQEKEIAVREIVKTKLPGDIAAKFIKENGIDYKASIGKFKIKREKLNGMLVQMYGIHFRRINAGDKLANRHGNKGVISRIVPHEKMPKLKDGRHLDICINPLGIISRMNIGQLYELHLSMSLFDLKKQLLNMIKEKSTQDAIKEYLLNYIKIIDRTERNWYLTQFEEQLPEEITEDFINELTLIQAPFESCKIEDIKQALAYTNTNFKEKLFDPISETELLNEVATGFLYFFRMVHIAEEKIAARGIGSYSKRTLQPLGGRKNKGGQRCGEMETACLIGHDAPENLYEFLTTKSDCIDLKNNYLRNAINPEMVDESKELDDVPESVKLLNAYLTIIGVEQ